MDKCPMCGTTANHKQAEIEQSVIAEFYRRSLKLDISYLLDADAPAIKLLRCDTCDLRWYSPAPSGDAAFYERLQENDWYYQDEKPEYLFAQSRIPAGATVLEVGCGKGAFSRYLPRDVVYRGLEFNEQAVAKARQAGLDIAIESIEAHARRQPRGYDIVCSYQVLEHVSQTRAFLDACVATLKPGGQLIIAVPSEDSFLSAAEGAFLNMPPHHLSRWSDQALTRAMEMAGLSEVEIWHEPVAEYHRDWYQSVMSVHALRAIAGQPHPLHVSDVLIRLAGRLNRIRPLRDWLAKQGEKRFAHQARGHTVCAVARKTAES